MTVRKFQTLSSFINPFWMRGILGKTLAAVVDETGKIELKPEILTFQE